MELDLEKYDSVEKFAKDILSTEEHIDFLVNNAGKLLFCFLFGIRIVKLNILTL